MTRTKPGLLAALRARYEKTAKSAGASEPDRRGEWLIVVAVIVWGVLPRRARARSRRAVAVLTCGWLGGNCMPRLLLLLRGPRFHAEEFGVEDLVVLDEPADAPS